MKPNSACKGTVLATKKSMPELKNILLPYTLKYILYQLERVLGPRHACERGPGYENGDSKATLLYPLRFMKGINKGQNANSYLN